MTEMLFVFFITTLLLCFFSIFIIMQILSGIVSDVKAPSAAHWMVAIFLPLMMAVYGLRRKSLDKTGASAAVVVGFLLSVSNFSFMASLLSCFIFASKATKYKSAQKKKLEHDFKEGGQRNWVQVLCNVGPACLMTLLYMLEVGCVDLPISFTKFYSASWYAVAVIASIACACGDTFASEIGSVSGKSDPFHIVKFKRVPRGTNGGISLVGTLSSLFGGALVGVFAYLTTIVSSQSVALQDAPHQWPIVLYATLAGGLGSLVDSVIGGSLQYSGRHKSLGCVVETVGGDVEHISGLALLDNHAVNFLSCLITGLIVPYIAAQSWTWVG